MIHRSIGTLLIASALLLFTPASSASQQSAGRAPVAVVNSTEHDFGEVFAGEEVWHTFNVHNAGTAPLELAERKVAALHVRRIAVSFAPARLASRPASPS
jgi:hypothetical protein